ncbi:hypothetical protein FQ707_08290 [Bacteroidaceae bacterium HV4-6-C5C]|jgi:hypothetical protein|nr:hypothetical protein FQ707_08290 [Bacteroidaceae bacterium HV4-6-C5C]
MKKLFWLLIIPLLMFASCSKGEDDNTTKVLSIWKQDAGDKSYWFQFTDKNTVLYTATDKGNKPYNYLGETFEYKQVDNTITIYKNSPAPKAIWLSGSISDNTMNLSGDSQTFELTKYIVLYD